VLDEFARVQEAFRKATSALSSLLKVRMNSIYFCIMDGDTRNALASLHGCMSQLRETVEMKSKNTHFWNGYPM